jgi:hypothetical protein
MNDGGMLGALGAEPNPEAYEIGPHGELEVNWPDLDVSLLSAITDTDPWMPRSSGLGVPTRSLMELTR